MEERRRTCPPVCVHRVCVHRVCVRRVCVLLVVAALGLRSACEAGKPTRGVLRKAVKVLETMSCPDMAIHKPLIIRKEGPSRWVVDGEFTLPDDTPPCQEVQVNISACDHSEDLKNLKNCRSFGLWKFDKNVCGVMQAKNMLWTPLYQNVHPHPHCNSKGTFKIKGAMVDEKLVSNLGFPTNKVMKVKLRYMSGEKKSILCFKLTGEIINVSPTSTSR